MSPLSYQADWYNILIYDICIIFIIYIEYWAFTPCGPVTSIAWAAHISQSLAWSLPGLCLLLNLVITEAVSPPSYWASDIKISLMFPQCAGLVGDWSHFLPAVNHCRIVFPINPNYAAVPPWFWLWYERWKTDESQIKPIICPSPGPVGAGHVKSSLLYKNPTNHIVEMTL